ncbi:MAG TPA: hypothetical protein VLD65_11530 [Anaerolineales bacterium]|nr:hypothetical protein [Anaerolineales bacterium]
MSDYKAVFFARHGKTPTKMIQVAVKTPSVHATWPGLAQTKIGSSSERWPEN